jgi:CDP-glucose 4,6-dehydratase
MENLDLKTIYSGRKVWISGHTGFKGSWLAEWLLELGAEVSGYSLQPPTRPSLFEQLELAKRLDHHIADINDAIAVRAAIHEFKPDFVFHLAAQPLVRASYRNPVETFSTNVLGTAHVLDALRDASHPCTAVFITTDKCYENRDWVHGYRENDRLGGYDPYSASKAAAELVIDSYRRSFFNQPGSNVRIASARAGNVIGGGDWAEDRIVPDAIRHLIHGKSIPVRNPRATRPWQHVLEPLGGYLSLAAHLSLAKESGELASAFNFGPNVQSNRSVEELVTEIFKSWPGQWEHLPPPGPALHEARLLHLNHDKAYHLLGWEPKWNFATTIKHTVDWYRNVNDGGNALEITRRQIRQFEGGR